MNSALKIKSRPSDVVIEDMSLFLNERFDANLADARRTIPPHILIELGRRGYAGLLMPKDRHGSGLSLGESLRFIRFLSITDFNLLPHEPHS